MPALERTPGSDTLIVGGVPFTHNIVLPGIGQTVPFNQPVAENGICQSALRDLSLAFPVRVVPPRIADLGCLDGGYAAAFAQAGYDATGFDVRPENIAHCQLVAERLNLPNLKFVQADVRQVFQSAGPGTWDAVFCCGLLYHLEHPVRFLLDAGRATRRLLIVQTHYSTRPDAVHEGRAGHWYTEDGLRESAWGNTRSFWLTREHLMAAIRDAGFDLVFEQVDYLNDITGGPVMQPDRRGMFVGIRSQNLLSRHAVS